MNSRSCCCTSAMQNCHSPDLALLRACYARSSSGIHEHDCLPHFLVIFGALPFYRSLDPRVISRTDQYFAVCLPTLARPATGTSDHTCITRLLVGTGCFLPSEAPTVLTRRTCALASKRELRARRVQGKDIEERGCQLACATAVTRRFKAYRQKVVYSSPSDWYIAVLYHTPSSYISYYITLHITCCYTTVPHHTFLLLHTNSVGQVVYY